MFFARDVVEKRQNKETRIFRGRSIPLLLSFRHRTKRIVAAAIVVAAVANPRVNLPPPEKRKPSRSQAGKTPVIESRGRTTELDMVVNLPCLPCPARSLLVAHTPVYLPPPPPDTFLLFRLTDVPTS